VAAAKGGIGKSTISTAIASALSQNSEVALIGTDITNPCLKTLTATQNQTLKVINGEKIAPITKGKLKIISTSHLLPNENTAIIWKGNRTCQIIKEFIKKVNWNNPDYLIVDTPAGISDEILSVTENLPKIDGAVVVTTPQKISMDNVRKTITMLTKMKIRIIGLIENMSGLICPKCKNQITLFPETNIEQICSKLKIPFLGRIPFNPEIAKEADKGQVQTLSVAEPIRMAVEKIKHLATKPKKRKKS